jgi:hypothetical protein
MGVDEEEDLENLAKFQIVKGVSIISLIYRETREFIYNFFHPMSRVEKPILAEAEKINKELELFYGDIKLYQLKDLSEVIFYEGNKTRLMAILKPNTLTDDRASIIERVLEKFLYEFEAKYAKILKEWDGDISVFKEADAMLYAYLNVDLTFPHTYKYRGFDPDDPLERYISEAADRFNKQIGYFYLDNLIFLTKEVVKEKAVEEGNDPKTINYPTLNKFYLAMFHLKKLGMLVKIDNFLEELSYYSKINY